MKRLDWMDRLNLMEQYAKDRQREEGWELLDLWKVNAIWRYTKPLTRLEKMMKKPSNPPQLLEAEMDDYGRITYAPSKVERFNLQ
jgi:hypothetical protein